MNIHSQEHCPAFNEIGFRGLVWIFVGIIYGFIFVSLAEFLRDVIHSPLNLLVATIGASTFTALFYGSLRLVVMIANAILVCFLLFLLFGRESGGFTLPLLILIPAALGMLIGAGYGMLDRKSRVCCADAKIIGGLVSGTITALIAGLAIMLIGDSPQTTYPWLVMCLAPIAGVIYVSTACWFVRHLQNLLPPIGDGAIVGLGVGAITGLLFVVIGGTIDPDITGSGKPLALLEKIYGVLGVTLVGTAASCFVLGAIRALLRRDWYKL